MLDVTSIRLVGPGRAPAVSAADAVAVPEWGARAVGALLALAVAAAHVADQGGITAFTDPDWLGWAYRVIEVGGVATAIALMMPRMAVVGWSAGLLLGALPFLGYLASRTVGVPGDSDDLGNWADWTGTLALLVEGTLVVVSAGLLYVMWRRARAYRSVRRIVPPERSCV